MRRLVRACRSKWYGLFKLRRYTVQVLSSPTATLEPLVCECVLQTLVTEQFLARTDVAPSSRTPMLRARATPRKAMLEAPDLRARRTA